ncbi:MAG: FliH/SctL family protein [Alphaproteobacteria bacterium]
MNEPKKFLFDNFIIDMPRKKSSINEDVLVSNDDMDLSVDNEVVLTDAVEQEASFSTEEVAKQIEEAKAEAYNQALLDAQTKFDSQEMQLFNMVNVKLAELLKNDDSGDKELQLNIKKIAALILEKLVPTIIKDEANNIIEQFLEQNFDAFKLEKKLSIYLNPENVSNIGEVIGRLADKNDFEGKISIIKDNNLSVGDCKVLWEYGGVSIEQNKIKEKIEEIIVD